MAAAQYDDDSDATAKLKSRAVSYDIRSNNWLVMSRSIVHMSFDFTLRRSTYRFLRMLARGTNILGRVGYHALKKKTKKKELTPYQHWETSRAKGLVSVYIAATNEDDDDQLLGVVNIDPKAPADILREYIRRHFKDDLNDGPWGDSFLFQKDKKGRKPEIFARAIEPKKYTKDVTVLRMDHITMEATQCVMLTAEPHVSKVLIEIPPDPSPDDDDEDIMGEGKDILTKEQQEAADQADKKSSAATAAVADAKARKSKNKSKTKS
jgi:hypothetical protein